MSPSGSLTQIFASQNIGSAKAAAGFENGVGIGAQGYLFTGTGDADVTVAAVFSAIAGGVVEEDSTASLETSGSLSFSDLDVNDSVTVSETSSSVTWSGGTLSDKLGWRYQLFGRRRPPKADQTGWTYDTSVDLDFLATDETITLVYNVVATDDSAATDAASIRRPQPSPSLAPTTLQS